MWAQRKHTWKSKINKRLRFLDSCAYKFELSVVRSAYSAITHDLANSFNVFLLVECYWSDLVHHILPMFSLLQLVIRLWSLLARFCFSKSFLAIFPLILLCNYKKKKISCVLNCTWNEQIWLFEFIFAIMLFRVVLESVTSSGTTWGRTVDSWPCSGTSNSCSLGASLFLRQCAVILDNLISQLEWWL